MSFYGLWLLFEQDKLKRCSAWGYAPPWLSYRNIHVMKVIISNPRHDILSSTESPALTVPNLHFEEDHYSSNESYWKSQVREIRYAGTHIATHRVNVLQPVEIRTTDAPPLISLFFVEKGAITTQANGTGQDWAISAMQHNLLYGAYATELTRLGQQPELNLSIISFTRERFFELAHGSGPVMESIAESVASGKNRPLPRTQHLHISLRMLEILRGLHHPLFGTSAKRLLIESNVLELLALQCEQFEQQQQPSNTMRLTAPDRRKLYAVRDTLLTDISHTPSLAELARLHGLNEFKLKTGFKQLFQQSVFAYLRDARMTYAVKALKKDDKSLTEIAYECGFATLSHFSALFKKKYGIAPTRLR